MIKYIKLYPICFILNIIFLILIDYNLDYKSWLPYVYRSFIMSFGSIILCWALDKYTEPKKRKYTIQSIKEKYKDGKTAYLTNQTTSISYNRIFLVTDSRLESIRWEWYDKIAA